MAAGDRQVPSANRLRTRVHVAWDTTLDVSFGVKRRGGANKQASGLV